MHIITKTMKNLYRNDSGATAMEYGLLAATISVVIIGGATLAGGALNNLFKGIANKLTVTIP